MPGRQKMWVYSPPKPPKPKVPDGLKAEVSARANDLVESVLKPRYVEPKPDDHPWNYIIDIFTKWFRGYFYFCATYRCPFPDAISPTFESRFARMEYIGEAHFALAFMRHTGQWVEIYRGLTVDECLTAIRDDPFFQR